MKTLRFGLVQIGVLLSLLICLSVPALAKTSISVNFGGGPPYFHHGFHPGYGWPPPSYPNHYWHYKPVGWYWPPYRPHVETIVVSPGYWYYGNPYYYVVTPPPVIEKVPVVIEKPTVIVQPGEDKDTQALFETLRYKKGELLEKLQMPDKSLRIEAINELAGFSFDDQVRNALENILLLDPDPELRKQVAYVFGEAKNAKALAALEKARVEDSVEDVRKEADNAIRKIEAN